MTIELTDLLAALDPDPVRILIGGKEFDVSNMPVADVVALGQKSEATNKDLAEFLKKLFGPATPPSIDRLLENYAQGNDAVTLGVRQRLTGEVMLIHQTLLAAIAEVGSPKKFQAAVETMRQRVTGMTASNSPASEISAG